MIDLSGGLDEAREFVFADQPDEPEMRESVNAWIWGTDSGVGMPRIGIEALADQWQTHDVQVGIALPGGRLLNILAPGPVHDPLGDDGKPRVLGAGPLRFELVRPFELWRLQLDGMAVERDMGQQLAGTGRDGTPSVPVSLDLELASAAPPWENGTLLPLARKVLAEQDEGAMMGGPRYEQLCRVTGTIRVGDLEGPFEGGALRIRRRGIRRMGTFRGHVWQSALLPSGRGFGCLVYPDRSDGLPTYNEAFVFEGDGALIPATVVEAPWLRRIAPEGEDGSVVLETAEGTYRIEVQTLLPTFHVFGSGLPVIEQSITRCTWGGETALGMLERSMPGDQVAWP